MRTVSWIALGASLAMLASTPGLAAGPFVGAPGLRPPAAVLPLVHGRHGFGRNGLGRQNGWGNANYPAAWLGTGWGFPGFYPEPGMAPLAPAPGPRFPPIPVVGWPLPLGQGDIGYVAQPAIYNVARQLHGRLSDRSAIVRK